MKLNVLSKMILILSISSLASSSFAIQRAPAEEDMSNIRSRVCDRIIAVGSNHQGEDRFSANLLRGRGNDLIEISNLLKSNPQLMELTCWVSVSDHERREVSVPQLLQISQTSPEIPKAKAPQKQAQPATKQEAQDEEIHCTSSQLYYHFGQTMKNLKTLKQPVSSLMLIQEEKCRIEGQLKLNKNIFTFHSGFPMSGPSFEAKDVTEMVNHFRRSGSGSN